MSLTSPLPMIGQPSRAEVVEPQACTRMVLLPMRPGIVLFVQPSPVTVEGGGRIVDVVVDGSVLEGSVLEGKVLEGKVLEGTVLGGKELEGGGTVVSGAA